MSFLKSTNCGLIGFTVVFSMADKKLDIDDINEMALDYIINTGGLPDSAEALQYCLHKFYQSLNKQDK
jgi:hypothetical protein